MKTQVDTIRFQAAHGKLPRGLGIWHFETQDRELVFEFYGTWGQAKKAAEQTNYGYLYAAS